MSGGGNILIRVPDLSGAYLGGVNLGVPRSAGRTSPRRTSAGQTSAGQTSAKANLLKANLSGAYLSEATRCSSLVGTDFSGANLTDCSIYGVSAWGLKLDGATQLNLVITPLWESAITVDNLEIAQFIYLLLNNQKIRQVIDTITSKVVLILGRFTEERKRVLDAIREELRRNNLTPYIIRFREAGKQRHHGNS